LPKANSHRCLGIGIVGRRFLPSKRILPLADEREFPSS
jgi:hypothetical protein